MSQESTFASLSVGDTFDFINAAQPMMNSFYGRCTKTSARCYTWDDGRYGTLKARVGSVKVSVYHVAAK